MPIYMNVDGVTGSVTAAGHEKWIELDSCHLGVNRHITNPTGKGVNREASVPAVNEITCTKVQDDASTNLFKLSLWGEGKTVKIDFCKTDQNQFQPYLQLELTNTLISSYDVSGHSGGAPGAEPRPTETLSLNFTKIQFTTIPMDPENAGQGPTRAQWDLAQGKGS